MGDSTKYSYWKPRRGSGFFTFLKWFRLRHKDWPELKIAVEGTRLWKKKTEEQKRKFARFSDVRMPRYDSDLRQSVSDDNEDKTSSININSTTSWSSLGICSEEEAITACNLEKRGWPFDSRAGSIFNGGVNQSEPCISHRRDNARKSRKQIRAKNMGEEERKKIKRTNSRLSMRRRRIYLQKLFGPRLIDVELENQLRNLERRCTSPRRKRRINQLITDYTTGSSSKRSSK